MKTWNFGIIGAGTIADFHARAIKDIDNAKLIGFCDTVPERAKLLAEKYHCTAYNDYQSLLQNNEIDIVTIATPSGFHKEPTIAAAKTGKHVLCEKPLEITLDHIDEMIEAHQKSNTYLGGIFNYRYDDIVEVIKNTIQSGRFGTITAASIYVPWWRSDEYYKDSWHGTLKLDGGGALMNQSIHMIDLLCYLMGDIESLQAFTTSLGHSQIEAEDTAVAILRFKNKALGLIYGTTSSYPGQPRRLEITGTKGTIIQLEDGLAFWKFQDETAEDDEIRERFKKIGDKGGSSDPAAIPHFLHTRNFKAFLWAIERGEKFEIDGQTARKAVEVILSIYKSAKENQK
jgi:UDP-N-acetyl-2-amino-2-deoxyglucuronate dehydrogenase